MMMVLNLTKNRYKSQDKVESLKMQDLVRNDDARNQQVNVSKAFGFGVSRTEDVIQ